MNKLTQFSALGLLLVLTVSGCSQASPEPTASPKSNVEAEKTDSASKAVEEATGEAVELELQISGAESEDGSPIAAQALVSSSVTSVELLSESELAEIQEAANADQQNSIKAYDLYRVAVTETYVSGGNPKGQAAVGNYRAVIENGSALQSVSAIGFDWCESGVYSDSFASGEANNFCLVTAVAKGDPAPVGVRFQQSDSKYDAKTGEPTVILVK